MSRDQHREIPVPMPETGKELKEINPTELLAFLEIPASYQLARSKHPDKKVAKNREREQRARTKVFDQTLSELVEGEKMKKVSKVAEAASMMAEVLSFHVLDQPKLIQVGKERQVVRLVTNTPESSIESRQLTIVHEKDQGFAFELESRQMRQAHNRLPVVETKEVMNEWMRRLFPGFTIEARLESHRPGGMRFEGGNPAAFQYARIRGTPHTKEEAFQLCQAFQFVHIFSNGLEEEVGRRSRRVLDNNWRTGDAYQVADGYLSDFIHEHAIAAFEKFFEGEGAALVGRITDVNVLVSEDRLTPTVSYQKATTLFGRPFIETHVQELPSISVSIPELRIDSVVLEPMPKWGVRSTKQQKVELPQALQSNIVLPYYPARGEPDFQTLKEKLLQDLDRWLRAKKKPRKSEFAEIHQLEALRNHLKTLNLTVDGLASLTPQEQEKRVKSVYRKLAVQYHPDRNPKNPEAHKKLVELNAAAEFLLKEYGLALMPS